MNKIVLFFFLIMLVYSQGLTMRYPPTHQIFENSWTGDKCDDACERENGQICGRISQECCRYRCQGWIWKSCQDDDVITNLDCTYRKPDGVKETISKGFKNLIGFDWF